MLERPSPAGLTRQAAEFIASMSARDVPGDLVDVVKIALTDCLAVMIAGSEEEPTRLVARLAATAEGDGTAPLIPCGRMVAASDAALVNGVASHALDYDDVAMDGHPSVALVPAILAEGWALGSSGKEAIAAYVAGYELWALLHSLEPGKLHEKGFHPTAIWGTVAAAAACSVLHRLDVEQAARAIALGASLAAGLVANFGTMAKPLHAGRTVQSGVIAARLAKDGFTASSDVLEHPTGFMNAHSASGSPDIADRDHALGRSWRMTSYGINIKRYPLCYSTHRAIDAMLDIVAEHDLQPAQVREVRVGAGAPEILMLRNHRPQTGLEAKFSMEFAMASALVARRVGLAELDEAFVRRPEVVEAMGKVRSIAIHDGLAGMPDSPPDTVEVELISGYVLRHPPVQHARGSWQHPLDGDELREKFLDCTRNRVAESTARDLFESLTVLDTAPELRGLLAPALAVPANS